MAPRKLDRPPGSAPPACVTAWFGAQDAGSCLLNSRRVRDYLSAFSPHAWPEATRLTLLLGVAAARAAAGGAPGATLSLAQLKRAVGAPTRHVCAARQVCADATQRTLPFVWGLKWRRCCCAALRCARALRAHCLTRVTWRGAELAEEAEAEATPAEAPVQARTHANAHAFALPFTHCTRLDTPLSRSLRAHARAARGSGGSLPLALAAARAAAERAAARAAVPRRRLHRRAQARRGVALWRRNAPLCAGCRCRCVRF
jgi:hypothetical protein